MNSVFSLPGLPAHCMDQHQSPEHNGHLEDNDENRLDADTEEALAEDQAPSRRRGVQELDRPRRNLSSITMASTNLPVSETVMRDSQAAAKRVSCILLY